MTRDGKGKVAAACDDPTKPDGIRKALAKACVDKGVSLAAAFPSCGAGGDVGSTHTCIVGNIPCLACRTVSVIDDFRSVDCDKFDDKRLNASCTSPQ